MIKADLSSSSLMEANLFGADLSKSDLRGANLSDADLRGAVLRNANLNEADLRGADLTDAKMDERQLDKAQMGVSHYNQIHELGHYQDFYHQKMLNTIKHFALASGVISFRINEEPLTPYNLATILVALTELYTKYWLAAKGRYADLVEFSQTRDVRFTKEAGTAITWATYNSPFNFGFPIDKVVPGAADGLMTVVDGLTQREAKRKKLELENESIELENRAREQQIKQDEQKSEHEQTMAALEEEQKRIEVEQKRLSYMEHRLELEKKNFEYAREIAELGAAISSPNVQTDIKVMIAQLTLNNILQLQNVTGLELALPPPKNDEEK